jgi:NAD(P)-dependent dehydrogenase (short-subunit alcohol dehydrogenase family)
VVQDVRGKVAVVTGGTSGIGLGIAKAFAAAGAKVVVTYRTGRHLDEALAFFRERPDMVVHPMALDVTDRQQMSRVADEVKDRFGKVHILCNNAGVGVLSKIMDATYDDWDWSLAVNIGGAVNGIQCFLPKLLEHGEGGHIVTTASMGGIFLGGAAGVYNTTKYALVGMMEALRAELEPHGVGASVYCPGLVDTNIHQTEEGRPAQFMNARPRLNAEQLSLFKVRVLSAGMDHVDAGQAVLEGVRRGDLYIFSHPEFYDGAKERFEAILGSLKGDMSSVPAARLQAEAATLRHPVYSSEIERRRIES